MPYNKKFVDKSKCAKYCEPIKIAEGFIITRGKPKKIVIYDTITETLKHSGGDRKKLHGLMSELGIETVYNTNGYARLKIIKENK